MSGIVGIGNLDGRAVDRELLRRMTDFMGVSRARRAGDLERRPVGFGPPILRKYLGGRD